MDFSYEEALDVFNKCLHPNSTFAYVGADGLHYHCCNCGKDIVTTWYELFNYAVDKVIEEYKKTGKIE